MKQFTFYPILLSIFFTGLANVALASKNPIPIRPANVTWSYEIHFEPDHLGSFSDSVVLIDKQPGEDPTRKVLFKGKLDFAGVPWASVSYQPSTDRAPKRSLILPLRFLTGNVLVMASDKLLFLYDTQIVKGPPDSNQVMSMERPPGNILEMAVAAMGGLYFISFKTDVTEGIWLYDFVNSSLQKITDKYSPELMMVYSKQNYEVTDGKKFKKIITMPNRKVVDPEAVKPKESTSRALVLLEEVKKEQAEKAEREARPPITQKEQQRLLRAKNQELQALRKHLNRMIIGQPEVINALIDIEQSDFRQDGVRSLPEVAMFVGLPETGKDTSAESYVIAKALVKNSKLAPEHQAKTKEQLDDLASNALKEHLFRVPRIKNEIDISLLIGSGPGYVGSSKISPMIKWLVKHSAGKYSLETSKDGTESVVLSSNWRPGMVKAGYYEPSEGVLFFNETHDWTKSGKNAILKEALEKAFFNIRNPNNGDERVEIPVTMFVASNECMGRILSIDNEGRRVGAPLTFEQKMVRWNISYSNYEGLKEDLIRGTPGNPEGGMSKEMVTRIPNSRFLLMRPLSNENLVKLTGIKLERVRLEYAQPKEKGFPWFRISWTEELPKFIVEYDSSSESGARSINDKIGSIVKKTLDDNIMREKLKPDLGKALPLDLKVNKDGTASLLVNKVRYFIELTKKEKKSQPPTEKEIKELLNVEKELNARVMGLEHITAQMAEDVRLSRNRSVESPANVYMLLGSSSTGKTELAVALHQVITKSNSKPAIVDGGRIHTRAQIEELILGRKDFRGEPIKSLFMQEYDRTNGELVFVLDEITNAPREVQNALYDMLREGVVTTFSDGIARPMGRVRFVLTGNAGEEWYRGIPREAPEVEQHASARKIYRKALNNPGFIRKFLQQHFSEAFINRVQEHRIFFFGPHTHKTVRQLIQLKLKKALKELSEFRKDTISWDVNFLSQSDYVKTIEAIETHGFKIWEQGASITGFIDNVLMKKVHLTLLDNLIPANAKVAIVKDEDVIPKDRDEERIPQIKFKLFVEGRKESLPVVVSGRALPKKIRTPNRNYILTAYHEAGHELVRYVLHGHRVRSKGIEIIPGVDEINGSWIRYLGVARSERTENFAQFERTIVEDIAILAAGYMGEFLTIRGSRTTSGKANDIQRATQIAEMAVSSAGFSEEFGLRSRLDNQSMEAYMSLLTEGEKEKFSKSVESFLKRGEALAREVIIANMDTFFLPLGQHLAKKGKVSGDVIERFYESRKGLLIHPFEKEKVEEREVAYKKRMAPVENPRIDFEFHPFADYKGPVIDVDALQIEEKRKNQAEADLSAMNEFILKPESLPGFRSALIKEKVNTAGLLGALIPTKESLTRTCRALFFR